MKDLPDSDVAARQAWMGVLAKAPAAALLSAWDAHGLTPAFTWLRAPEVGGVMVRGRAGATGAAFNLGEMTVTRCALKLADGRVGHAVVQGRDTRKAEVAALCDALMQGAEAAQVRAAVLDPVEATMARAAHTRAAKAAATKVDFFTMVRGD
ncbi:phosphonate C-P lyase system protein PhnG [Pseudooceanicola onchidii]|uniref:phosphonate C-P lyase system protein PhnG n=1 Tax=Pseudooceanicola onchidii TaxID=2562279 RepID=UPI0010AACF20|nr:phosphonate C-P lyase system protein PhnG [Pseudooceanicola onchidii]